VEGRAGRRRPEPSRSGRHAGRSRCDPPGSSFPDRAVRDTFVNGLTDLFADVEQLLAAAGEGDGVIGVSMPAATVAQSFDAARNAWKEAGRTQAPRLVAIARYAVGDFETGRSNVFDYCSVAGDDAANLAANNLSGGAEAITQTVEAFEDLGTDELVLSPGVADLDDVSRLADIVL
jgi:hypothetical protein